MNFGRQPGKQESECIYPSDVHDENVSKVSRGRTRRPDLHPGEPAEGDPRARGEHVGCINTHVSLLQKRVRQGVGLQHGESRRLDKVVRAVLTCGGPDHMQLRNKVLL